MKGEKNHIYNKNMKNFVDDIIGKKSNTNLSYSHGKEKVNPQTTQLKKYNINSNEIPDTAIISIMLLDVIKYATFYLFPILQTKKKRFCIKKK